jgi:hypothetical protein
MDWGLAFLVATLFLGMNLGHAQSGVVATFTSAISWQTLDARSAPAQVTSDDEKALTSKGYAKIGTISASKESKMADAEITQQLEEAILQKAAGAGGDVVRFTKVGELESETTKKGKHVVVSEGTVWRNDPKLASMVHLTDLASEGVEKELEKQLGDPKEDPDEALARAFQKQPDSNVAATEAVESLHKALVNGDNAGAESLLAHDGEVNARDNTGDALLHHAAREGYGDVAELLLAHGADVNARDEHGETPLLVAAKGGNKDLAELLLAHGADVNAKDNDGSTPLTWAAYLKFRDVVEVLRRHGGHK